MTKSINRWCYEAHDLAKNKGWYETNPNVAERIAMIHSEVTELLVSIRNNERNRIDETGKPEGPSYEAADVFLRLVDFCAWQGINLEDAVDVKHSYNRTRPHRHGGRKF